MTDLLDDLRAHDRTLKALGLDVWIGAEPTFTLATSQEPWWLYEAEGGDKEERARRLLLALAPRVSMQTSVGRVRGRQFPEEPKPRFCYCASWPRDEAEPPSRRSVAPLDPSVLAEPPPEDAKVIALPPACEVAFLTVTPDPGVVEVNMAPVPSIEAFLLQSRAVHAAAADAGLSPTRFRYNGDRTDSGGGGQITFGGPTPEASPFFRHPQLLPRLLRYFNRHPSLSYWFAMECVGSASQGPRADEGVRERFEELAVAVDRVADDIAPHDLWSSFAPLLVDSSGNAHRAEINIEKLWNPGLPDRGCLGVVELRALRMEPTPERMTAVATLLRAIVARLASKPYAEPLIDWGGALHDRFALPWFLADDLRAVLSDLEASGVGLGRTLIEILLAPPEPVAELAMKGATLELIPAREFWPLVGDVASQERHGARLVDASTERVEVRVTAHDGRPPGQLSVRGHALPLVEVDSRADARVHVIGVRRRAFVPKPGLHPALGADDPVRFVWTRDGETRAIELHAWNPGGGAYPGLPSDPADAEARRRARVVVHALPTAEHAATEAKVTHRHCVDLRRLT